MYLFKKTYFNEYRPKKKEPRTSVRGSFCKTPYYWIVLSFLQTANDLENPSPIALIR